MRFRLSLIHITCIALLAVSTQLLSAQSNPLYSPSSSNLVGFQCLDQYGYPVPYANFSVSSFVYLYSNYHMHDDPSHLWSSVSPSYGGGDAYGDFYTYLNTTLIGQAEGLSVTCWNANGSANGTFNYVVGYGDIVWNDHPELWILIGGNSTTSLHGDNSGNHWMQCTQSCTAGPAYGYYYTVSAYVSTYNSGNQVCANDMALMVGGKFDIHNNWTSPHISHDRGTAVDTATTTNQCSSSNVVTNPSAFLQECINNLAKPYPVSQIDAADVHCNWADPATYPH